MEVELSDLRAGWYSMMNNYSLILRSGTCAALYVILMHESECKHVHVRGIKVTMACLKHRKQGEGEIYVKFTGK